MRHEFRVPASDLRMLMLVGESGEPLVSSGDRIVADTSQLSRRGHDWTERFHRIREALAALQVRQRIGKAHVRSPIRSEPGTMPSAVTRCQAHAPALTTVLTGW